MLYSVVGFLLADVVYLVTFIVLVVMAFRTRLAWGFVALLAPFGSLAFAIKHWVNAGKLYILHLICAAACGALLFTSPPLMAMYASRSPGFTQLAKWINPTGLAEGQKELQRLQKARPGNRNEPGQPPHEARDLADSEAPSGPAAPPSADPNAARRAACVKHATELNVLYQELNAERTTLKPGSPFVAAFNARAARYQQGLQALTAEKAQLDALDHPAAPVAAAPAANAGPGTPAATALADLKAAVETGDYAGFAATLKKCLADYRQTPEFPQIAAFARATLQNTPADKLPVILRNKLAAAHAEYEQTGKRVQGIVNQVPPTVPKPPAGAEVYHYAFHPGADKPDFNTADIVSKREPWLGEFVYIETVPNVFYRSADCEFNPQTKFFFTRRDVPKKKLTDAENQEVVRLYRILGKDEKVIATVTPQLRDTARTSADLAALKAQLAGYAMK